MLTVWRMKSFRILFQVHMHACIQCIVTSALLLCYINTLYVCRYVCGRTKTAWIDTTTSLPLWQLFEEMKFVGSKCYKNGQTLIACNPSISVQCWVVHFDLQQKARRVTYNANLTAQDFMYRNTQNGILQASCMPKISKKRRKERTCALPAYCFIVKALVGTEANRHHWNKQ